MRQQGHRRAAAEHGRGTSRGHDHKPLDDHDDIDDTTPTTTTPTATTPAPAGDATAGKAVFASAGCGACHTLKAADSSGVVGPNLDQLKPDAARVATQVTNGGAAMPSFKSRLTPKQIADVAAFVSQNAGG